jgi:hypothetical protein
MKVGLPKPVYSHQLVTIPTVVEGERPTGDILGLTKLPDFIGGNPDQFVVRVEDVDPTIGSRYLTGFVPEHLPGAALAPLKPFAIRESGMDDSAVVPADLGCVIH